MLLTAAWYATVCTLHIPLNHYTPAIDTSVTPTSFTTNNTPHKCLLLGCVWISLGYIPRSGIAGSYGTWILWFNSARLLSIMIASVCMCVCFCVCAHCQSLRIKYCMSIVVFENPWSQIGDHCLGWQKRSNQMNISSRIQSSFLVIIKITTIKWVFNMCQGRCYILCLIWPLQ